MTDAEDRRAELNTRIGELLAEYVNAMSPDSELPVLTDWVVVAAVDDAANPSNGSVRLFHPPHQWRHRSAGLLQAAVDDQRCLVKQGDD